MAGRGFRRGRRLKRCPDNWNHKQTVQMRSSKSRSRNKSNRQRSLGNIINRVFDSSGPEGKVRGTPQQIIDKYLALARDAQLSNDRVAEQSFLQHAEHYTRMLSEAQREMAERQQHHQQNNNQRQNGDDDRDADSNGRDNNGYDQSQRSQPREEQSNALGDAENAKHSDQPEQPQEQPRRARQQRQPRGGAPVQPDRQLNEPDLGLPAAFAPDDEGDESGLIATPETVSAPKPRTRTPRTTGAPRGRKKKEAEASDTAQESPAEDRTS